mgnify:CR=1 FL=1
MPCSSRLSNVLENGNGSPGSLAVLYLEICARLSLPLQPMGKDNQATRARIELARSGECRMADVIDEKSIVNMIVALLATGGSTNHAIHLPAIARLEENTAPAVDPLLPLEPGRRQVGWPADPRDRLRLNRCSAKYGRHNGDRNQFQIHYVPQGEFSQQLGRYWGRFVSE